MSADRLREMLSEATTDTGVLIQGNTQAARLTRLAPDAIALLADFGDALEEWIRLDRRGHAHEELLARLDALCGER